MDAQISSLPEQGRRQPHLAIAVFVAFLWSGVFKSSSLLQGLPIDFTVLVALCCILLSLVALLRSGFQLPAPLIWVMLLYASISIPLLWTDWGVYAQSKVARMFTLNLLAMVFPMLWITTWRALRVFFWYVAVVGAVVCSGGLWRLVSDPVTFSLEVFSNDYITVARVAGVLALWLLVLMIHGRDPKRFGYLAALPIPIAIMVASGSRGPTLAFVLALAALGAFAYLPRVRYWGALLVVSVILAFAIAVSFSVAPPGAKSRLQEFYAGDVDFSTIDRDELYAQGLASILESPEGVGWGGFERVSTGAVGREKGEGPVQRHYPHNLLIETLLEGGWQAGIVLLFVLSVAVLRAVHGYRMTGLVQAHALFGVLVFLLVGAMFSGDWNDNRDLFAVVSLALFFGRGHAQAGSNPCSGDYELAESPVPLGASAEAGTHQVVDLSADSR